MEYPANCNSLVITIFHSTNADQGHNGQLRLSLQYELNISIVNALWVFLTGELLSLNDNKLKVKCLNITFNVSIICLYGSIFKDIYGFQLAS